MLDYYSSSTYSEKIIKRRVTVLNDFIKDIAFRIEEE